MTIELFFSAVMMERIFLQIRLEDMSLRSNGDRSSSPTPTATDSPIGITTFQPGLEEM